MSSCRLVFIRKWPIELMPNKIVITSTPLCRIIISYMATRARRRRRNLLPSQGVLPVSVTMDADIDWIKGIVPRDT